MQLRFPVRRFGYYSHRLLAAIGVPAYKNMTDKARKTACQANQRAISTAVGMYYAENG